MSNYSDKRVQAVCAYGTCDLPGTKLQIQNGTLNWYCENHTHD